MNLMSNLQSQGLLHGPLKIYRCLAQCLPQNGCSVTVRRLPLISMGSARDGEVMMGLLAITGRSSISEIYPKPPPGLN